VVLLGTWAGVAIDLHNSPLTTPILIKSVVLHFVTLGLLVLVINKIEVALWTARKQAMHDPLTGLLNRRALAEFGGEMFNRCQTLNEPMTAVMIDCNDFKALNDEYGHQAGDHTLQLLARALETETRKMDIVARVGGDEFIMLLPGSDEAEAKKVMARVEDAFIGRVCDAGYATSLSVGLAVATSMDHHFDALLGRADDRMYHMKAKTKSQAYWN
jgi:diguanylate cyclase (GGDEF)-like protein